MSLPPQSISQIMSQVQPRFKGRGNRLHLLNRGAAKPHHTGCGRKKGSNEKFHRLATDHCAPCGRLSLSTGWSYLTVSNWNVKIIYPQITYIVAQRFKIFRTMLPWLISYVTGTSGLDSHPQFLVGRRVSEKLR